MDPFFSFFMLDHAETAVPFWFIVVLLVGYYTYLLVRWNFRRLERKYGLRPLEILRIWRAEVAADGLGFAPFVACGVMALLLGHWIVWTLGACALLIFIGSAMTAHRLRSAHPPTIGGVVAEN